MAARGSSLGHAYRCHEQACLYSQFQLGDPNTAFLSGEGTEESFTRTRGADQELNQSDLIHAIPPLLRHRDAHLTALAHTVCADAPN